MGGSSREQPWRAITASVERIQSHPLPPEKKSASLPNSCCGSFSNVNSPVSKAGYELIVHRQQTLPANFYKYNIYLCLGSEIKLIILLHEFSKEFRKSVSFEHFYSMTKLISTGLEIKI